MTSMTPTPMAILDVWSRLLLCLSQADPFRGYERKIEDIFIVYGGFLAINDRFDIYFSNFGKKNRSRSNIFQRLKTEQTYVKMELAPCWKFGKNVTVRATKPPKTRSIAPGNFFDYYSCARWTSFGFKRSRTREEVIFVGCVSFAAEAELFNLSHKSNFIGLGGTALLLQFQTYPSKSEHAVRS